MRRQRAAFAAAQLMFVPGTNWLVTPVLCDREVPTRRPNYLKLWIIGSHTSAVPDVAVIPFNPFRCLNKTQTHFFMIHVLKIYYYK